MNQPPKSFVLVRVRRFLSFATACFEKVGLEREHAVAGDPLAGQQRSARRGYDRTLLPGAVEEELFELHRREGIRYGEPEQADLRRVSNRLGIPLPWE